jgi:hypothetical protein
MIKEKMMEMNRKKIILMMKKKRKNIKKDKMEIE